MEVLRNIYSSADEYAIKFNDTDFMEIIPCPTGIMFSVSEKQLRELCERFEIELLPRRAVDAEIEEKQKFSHEKSITDKFLSFLGIG